MVYISKKPHIHLAKQLWQQLVLPEDFVIDATCGNGNDTLTLAKLVPQGKVFAFDIQKKAIQNTYAKLKEAQYLERVVLLEASHALFSDDLVHHSIRLIVYNLGYLPQGDKTITTLTPTTLQSLQKAQDLLMVGGSISITLYPGHEEGYVEKQTILLFAQSLNPLIWRITHTTWPGHRSPSLLWIEKKGEILSPTQSNTLA